MRKSIKFLCGLAACSLLLVSSRVDAAAALQNGARTSCKPTASNPALRQIQIAADPIGILDFQFTIHWDPQILHLVKDGQFPVVSALNGYVLGVRGSDATAYAFDEEFGFITVRGFWPASNGPVPDLELDVYDVKFQLNDTLRGFPLPLDTPFILYTLGLPAGQGLFDGQADVMTAGDIINGDPVITRTYTGGDPANPILPANTGLITIPEPAAMGALAPVVLLLVRRRK